ncbi:MAG: hypothetical protein EXR62_13405 [Chloroflexi bacterium]|nr:hypothetical protein [Chloroflexota bacterium]
MTPVVNGLEATYRDRVDFRRLNAEKEGKAPFEAYHLRGHPGYILLKPDGKVLWQGLGPKSAEELAAQIEAALARP